VCSLRSYTLSSPPLEEILRGEFFFLLRVWSPAKPITSCGVERDELELLPKYAVTRMIGCVIYDVLLLLLLLLVRGEDEEKKSSEEGRVAMTAGVGYEEWRW